LTAAYWKRYYSAFSKVHPDWDDELVEKEVNAAMRRFRNEHDK